MKIIDIFGENRVKFVEKWKIINIWRMLSVWQGKLRKLRAKFFAFWQKWRNFENVKEKYEIFWSKYLWKSDFFTFLLNISWISDFSERIYLWKIRQDLYSNFFRFRGGPPPPPPGCYWSSWIKFLFSKLDPGILEDLGFREVSELVRCLATGEPPAHLIHLMGRGHSVWGTTFGPDQLDPN